jgi:hypothetical protein
LWPPGDADTYKAAAFATLPRELLREVISINLQRLYHWETSQFPAFPNIPSEFYIINGWSCSSPVVITFNLLLFIVMDISLTWECTAQRSLFFILRWLRSKKIVFIRTYFNIWFINPALLVHYSILFSSLIP